MAASGDCDGGFQRVLTDFKRSLTEAEKSQFQCCSLQDVFDSISRIQDEQKQTKTFRNLARIKPFLEAMGQFSEVIQVFVNTYDLLAFVWVSDSPPSPTTFSVTKCSLGVYKDAAVGKSYFVLNDLQENSRMTHAESSRLLGLGPKLLTHYWTPIARLPSRFLYSSNTQSFSIMTVIWDGFFS